MGVKLSMELGGRGYEIIIKRGSLARANRLCNLNRKVLVVTDEGVPARYAKTILAQCGEGYVVTVPQGEGSKSIAVWQGLLNTMLEKGFGRTDAVAAVGGGVVGDLAGYAAAAYMRGVAFFQFPTTTLSQIDSSIGGKVALNLGGTKNTVGAFHQPSLVAADPDTLKTLPARQWANGMAEALKAGLVGSTPLFELLENEGPGADIERVLYYALRFKKGVVERDETEQGERKLLNFGHTIGHGIEAAAAQAAAEDPAARPLLHGECVALGMLPMIESRTLLRRAKAVMKKLGLPLSHSLAPEKILAFVQNDKKRDGGSYTIARVKKLGLGYLETVDFEELRLMAQQG